MPKVRSPNRDKAFEIYKNSNGSMSLSEIAKLLNLSDGTIRGWKNKDKWNEKLNEAFQKNKERSNKKGAPKGNKNAVGNKGGSAPVGNENNYKHGIYKKLLYSSLSDDEKELLNLNELNESEELKFTINLCDIQIARFMHLIKETTEKGNFLLKSVNNSNSKDERGKLIGSVTTTSTVNTNEIIIRYNTEIEKIKKQKIKCLEALIKIEENNKLNEAGNNTNIDVQIYIPDNKR